MGMIKELAMRSGGGGGKVHIYQMGHSVEHAVNTVAGPPPVPGIPPVGAAPANVYDYDADEQRAYMLTGYGNVVTEGTVVRIPASALTGFRWKPDAGPIVFVTPPGTTQVRVTNTGANTIYVSLVQLT